MANTPTSGATPEAAPKDPNLPPLHRVDKLVAPKPPQDIAGTGLEPHILADLVVKWGFTETRFSTEWVAEKLRLSTALTRQVLERVCMDGAMEQLWQTGTGGHHFRITPEGRQHASRLLEICGYIGPAPVSLDSYTSMLRWQFAHTPQVKPERVAAALSGLVIPPKAAQLCGLAVSSGRSLFLFGPPGNGKSSIGRSLHAALPGDYWIPYAISVGNDVIRMFDDQAHSASSSAPRC